MIARTPLAGTMIPMFALVLPASMPAAGSAADTDFADFPFMVHCKHDEIDRAFYLSKLGPDGVAIYISPDRQAGIVTIDGPAKPIGGAWSGSCSGKTVKQLRAAGQAFDVAR